MADILQYLEDNGSRLLTRVLYGTNMDYVRGMRYIRLLQERELVYKNDEGYYSTTPKGRDFLARYLGITATVYG